MRNPRLLAALASFVAIYGLAMPPAIEAAQTPGINFATGSVCQLSIPTTDTKFRPKATGARNESTTTSNFVICPLPSSLQWTNDAFDDIYIGLYSLDGASHNVSCTAVSGWRESGYVYSTKNWVVTNTEVGHPDSYMVWNAGDFGGTAGDQITSSLAFSITCLLPPQTAIDYIQGELKYEIGT
jgi:hypothetical protein